MLVDKKIVELIQKHCIASTKVPVKFLNTNMNSSKKQIWWEIVFLPNNLENECWDDGKVYQGFVNLLLHYPQNNKGIYEAFDIVEELSKAFEKGTVLGDELMLTITHNPNIRAVAEEKSEVIIPLTLRYSCFRV